eukprot:TRINITY_DN49790_c0_g1_i1.p1 TRINITY_DN49790_c0_g1~~TRINITY_DN49790_c0_g1_i1.p1  ORF type:complete len:164 (+),score=21.09 TRINITY_DN49790_c0_g1_i1:60-551(+)
MISDSIFRPWLEQLTCCAVASVIVAVLVAHSASAHESEALAAATPSEKKVSASPPDIDIVPVASIATNREAGDTSRNGRPPTIISAREKLRDSNVGLSSSRRRRYFSSGLAAEDLTPHRHVQLQQLPSPGLAVTSALLITFIIINVARHFYMRKVASDLRKNT